MLDFHGYLREVAGMKVKKIFSIIFGLLFADIALAVEEHWSCVNTVNPFVKEHGSPLRNENNNPETLRWLDKTMAG